MSQEISDAYLAGTGPQIEAGSYYRAGAQLRVGISRRVGNLFPDDAGLKNCAPQTFLLSEFLQHHAPGYQPNQLSRRISFMAIVIRKR